MELDFETLLALYEHHLDYARRMKKPDELEFFHKTNDYWNGYAYSAFRAFEDLKSFCKDLPRVRHELTDEEKAEFDIKEGFPLCGIIDYRDHKIPVYDDDYGQQMFTEIDGEEIGGGAYNLSVESDFTYVFDKHYDLKDFNGGF